MKVYIGPYRSWIGPYQIAEKLLFWLDKHEDGRVHDFGTWLAQDKDGNDSWLMKLCEWINKKKHRKIKVRIDKYDTWSMDHTLALIVLPMLKQLQATKHGSPLVEDEDVPEELRSTSAPPKKNEWDSDENLHKRWDWAIEQMIWSFEQILDDDEGRDNYYDDGNFNMEKYVEYNQKVQVGLTLFGKYFRGLWD